MQLELFFMAYLWFVNLPHNVTICFRLTQTHLVLFVRLPPDLGVRWFYITLSYWFIR